MYSLGRLLEDAVRQRGPLTKGGGNGTAGYQACWDAFNRYVSAVLAKRQTLSMSNFCKVGWRLEESAQAKVKLRPHFQISESFARAYGLDARALPAVSDKALTAVEEFNFSKAAIRFSNNLSKESLFMGMRALLQLLGEAMASGQAVCLELEVGRLRCADRGLAFDFAPELYASEGLEVPKDCASKSDYRPSATFVPPTSDALALSVGRREGEVKSHSAFLGGWEEGHGSARRRHADEAGSEAGSRLSSAGGASATPSSLSRLDVVANEHLHRHLARIEEEAAQAVAEKQQWEQYLQRLSAEEQAVHQKKRAGRDEYAQQLADQIREVERRREQGRQFAIEQASQHGFPQFPAAPNKAAAEKLNDRKKALKDELDGQVEQKRRAKAASKQKDLELEAVRAEATKRELAQLRLEAGARRELEKAALHQAWDKDKRLHTLRKTIEEHHRTPASRATLSNPGAAAPPATPRLDYGGLPAPSPRAALDFDTASQASSRPMTGSVRRVPFGAAASLALHKERLGQTARR